MIAKLQALPAAAFQISFAMGGGFPRIITPLLLSMLACPSHVVRPSIVLAHSSLCSLPCHFGREGHDKGEVRSLKRGFGLQRLLLATVGTSSGPRDGQGDRHADAMCRSSSANRMGYSRNHAMCGDAGACKQWEGLSCAEVDNLIHSVQKYERVYSDTNLIQTTDSRSGQ